MSNLILIRLIYKQMYLKTGNGNGEKGNETDTKLGFEGEEALGL